MKTNQPEVRLVELSKAFGETVAVDRISLEIFGAEILGLVGPNGSGKSTLVDMISGRLAPDSGEIQVGTKPVSFRHPADALDRGIRMLSQVAPIFPFQSVVENIFLGQEISRSILGCRIMQWKKMESRAVGLLSRLGADGVKPKSIAGHLSGGQKQAVALARLLTGTGKVVILDEPTAALGVRQQDRLLQAIRSIASSGTAVILVSHQMKDILEVCDRVVVLSDGRVTADHPRDEVTESSLLLELSRSESGGL